MDEHAVPAETARAIDQCSERFAPELDDRRLVFGFDGVVDTVRVLIDERHEAGGYDTIDTLTDLRDLIDRSTASGSSLTVEWKQKGTRTGGHACHLARAFGALGADPVLIGTYGTPVREEFRREFSAYTTVSVGEPSFCDAIEFDDGKLLLPESGEARDLDWETLRERAGEEALAGHLDGAAVLGIGYWNVTSHLPELLADLVDTLWPRLESPPEFVLFDPGDIRRLPATRLQRGTRRLEAVNDTVPVTLSANRAETGALARALDGDSSGTLEGDAFGVFDGLGIERFVGHGVDEAVAVSAEGSSVIRVPKTDRPEMTTSAGDHFNAGLIAGLLQDLPDAAALVLANSTAGVFVRTGSPPSHREIRRFVEDYPERLRSTRTE